MNDTDEIISLRRWLREKDDEIVRLKADVRHYQRIAETRHFEDSQHDAFRETAETYFQALVALVNHLHPRVSLTVLDRWDQPWPQVAKALRK